MNYLSKFVKAVGIVVFTVVALAIALPVIVIIGVPLAVFGGLYSLVELGIMPLLRHDPRPPKEVRSQTKWPDLESEYLAMIEETATFIKKHVPGVKAKKTKKRDSRRAGELFQVEGEYVTTLTSTHPNALPVTLKFKYSGEEETLSADPDVDLFYAEEGVPEFHIYIESPISDKDIKESLTKNIMKWVAIAALRGDVKISRAGQVWFYLKEHDIWAVNYGNKLDLDSIGCRKHFSDKKTGPFRLR